jgi:hypothetical protein
LLYTLVNYRLQTEIIILRVIPVSSPALILTAIPAHTRALPEVVPKCGRGAAPAAEVDQTEAPGGFRKRRPAEPRKRRRPARVEEERMPSYPPVRQYDRAACF